jgi:hypothetical protein
MKLSSLFILLIAALMLSACSSRGALTSPATPTRPAAPTSPTAPTRPATPASLDTPTRSAAPTSPVTLTRPATPTSPATPTRPAAQTSPDTATRPATPTIASASKRQSVIVAARATKIAQLVGDYDRERKQPTANLTATRYKLAGTDLGVPFRHKDRIYLLFGDTVGPPKGDAIAYTTDTTPDDGLDLQFIHDASGTYQPVRVPGISQGGFEVPMEGVSIGGRMYIYHTTDSGGALEMNQDGVGASKMGRSVVAVSDDDGQTFTYLYDLSTQHFINVSVVEVDSAAWLGLPQKQGTGLVMFGSGAYRRSNVYLAFQPAAEIGTRASMRYFAGLDGSGQPVWSAEEKEAQALFDQPCVGELSVSYNRFIRQWLMLYNCFLPQWRGINLRTADQPWGPWSDAQLIFHPWDDQGYCHFMHASWRQNKCDEVHDPGRENVWAGEYGPYQFEDFAVGDDSTTTIYFTMSTWNPYTVVLMKAQLKLVR